MDLIQSLTSIVEKNERRVTIYVAIGSAAHMAKYDEVTGISSIEPIYDQQYPMFLKTLKTTCLTDPLYIYLFDPSLEDIPFIVKNKFGEGMEEGWICEEFELLKIYTNLEMNIRVYSIKRYVIYPYDMLLNPMYDLSDVDPINLTDFFNQLNIYAIEKKWFVVAHDFSGKEISKLGYYYDDVLKGHLDHIIYGLGSRTDEGGCYIDLTDINCQFVYEISDVDIKVFNPFNIDNTFELFELLNSMKELDNYNIMKTSVDMYIRSKTKLLINDVMTLLRRLGNLYLEKDFDMNIINTISIFVIKKTGMDILEMIKSKQYKLIIDSIIIIIKSELEKIINHFYKDATKSVINVVIGCMLYNPDPYRWYMHINKLLLEVSNN